MPAAMHFIVSLYTSFFTFLLAAHTILIYVFAFYCHFDLILCKQEA